MYSWKNIRAICAVLLLLPVVHLAYLVSRDALAILDASPSAWAAEMRAYAKADQKLSRVHEPLIVVGGQRVKLWRDLPDILAPREVLMRGLGDATVNDILYYYDRLIGYHYPQTLVVLPGNSEFHIRDGKSAEELFDSIVALAEVDANQGSTRHLYIFTPIKTPRHPADNDKIDKVSRMLREWGSRDERIAVLDANRLLSKRDGDANPSFYRSDGINLNDQGYLRLSMMLLDQVEQDSPEIEAQDDS